MKKLTLLVWFFLPILVFGQGDSVLTEEYFDVNYQRPQKYIVGGG